ncbi:MAG TPA: hypothetical protein VFQ50_06940 [Flavobacterium sp.]|jgi:hypothetical protein|nr:hypothetical protein [Flavobacterium sp.]
MKFSHATTANHARPLKAKTAKIENIEDLYEDDGLRHVQWTERALMKAMPKAGIKVKKMKSR